MRLSSAARIKGTKVGATSHDCPVEGSVCRVVWDKLQANKGTFVSVVNCVPVGAKNISVSLSNCRRDLTDFWGLDIAYKPKGIWCLVGEWKGKEYVDYLAEKYK